ncbi:MAG: YfdX family protein [Pirellulales bacterium]|nr:YfdX family protein [Pirellulales bacterium]
MRTVVTALALALALCSFCPAADHPAKTFNTNMPAGEMMKVSQDGFTAMRAIRAARLAIFNGEPEVATEMLDKAKNNLQQAYNDFSEFFNKADYEANGHTQTGTKETSHVEWIPIDGQVALAETYVPSLEKAKHIDKANIYFKNGQSKQAIEELKLGEIDVSYTCILMPWDATWKCVTEAAKLADEHKYYEANLALKAAEDGLIIDSTSLVGTPTEETKEHRQNHLKNQNRQQHHQSEW